MQQISLQQHVPHLSTIMPRTLLDLAFIKITGVRTPSLLAPEMHTTRPVFSPAAGRVDFDIAKRTNRCEIGRTKQ